MVKCFLLFEEGEKKTVTSFFQLSLSDSSVSVMFWTYIGPNNLGHLIDCNEKLMHLYRI